MIYTRGMGKILRSTCLKMLKIVSCHPECTHEGSQRGPSKSEILREYAQDDGYFSSFAGVAQSHDDSG
jgi:hypothetical protein